MTVAKPRRPTVAKPRRPTVAKPRRPSLPIASWVLVFAALLPTIATPAAGSEECIELASLPYQQVNGARLVHLGSAAGHAGAHVRLCPQRGMVAGYRFKVREAGVVLDCGGTRFSGTSESGVERVGLELDRGHPIHDVVVRGCGFHGYETGVLLTGANIDAALGSGPRRIRLMNVEVVSSSGVGVYVGPHARDVELRHLTVQRSGTVGIYIDAEASRVRISRSRIEDNGWSRCPLGREGIAVDAASDVTITENIFERNRYAAVALYRNCGESNVARPWVTRDVRLVRNIFRDHASVSGGAVVVGSRQGLRLASTRCFTGECVDEPREGGRFVDHVRDVLVSENLFIGGEVGVRVQAPSVSVVGNTFGGARLVIGLPWLASQPDLGGTVRVRRNAGHVLVDGGGLSIDTD